MKTWKEIFGRIVFKITSAQWILAVGFMAAFSYCLINSIDIPDYGVMLGTLIVKSYFDRNRPSNIELPEKVES